MESEASKRAADHLGLAADQVPNFQRAFADQLSFYWIECDRRAAEPPSPEQVRVELRELAEGLKLAYGSVHRMSEPARLALLSECRSLYPELGPLRPLLDNLVHTLRQLHAMGESALEKIEVRPGPRINESLTILINVLANLYEEFSGKSCVLVITSRTPALQVRPELSLSPDLQEVVTCSLHDASVG